MISSLEHMIDRLTMYFITACLFLTLFILTWVGVGNIVIVGILGLLLCAAGFTQGSAQADLWVLVPLILYNLFSIVSSYAEYGNFADGYASTQMIYPVIYLVLSQTDEKQKLSLQRLCALWAAIAATACVAEFIYKAVIRGGAWRVGGFLGNPNAMGIFLVIGWFALSGCREDHGQGRMSSFLIYTEPFLLAALALTLSMGSFAAMAAGIAMLLYEKKRQDSLKGMLWYAGNILSKIVLGVGVGLLIYLTGTRTNAPWICILLFVYLLALAICWRKLEHFLDAYVRVAAGIALSGIAVTVIIILIRPSSYATFAERLEMMRSALKYLTVNPLLGVGPYRWRFLDMYDGGTYYNTWHIHNVLLHVGVETGLIAMAMLAIVAVRVLCKKNSSTRKAGFMAFLFHNMMDTSFFYIGITTMILLTSSNSQKNGKTIRTGVMRVLFGGLSVFFVYSLFYYLTA